MEFIKQEPRFQSSKNTFSQINPDLQMYTDIPKELVNIEEFQDLAIERVKLLRALEVASVKMSKEMSWKDTVLDELQKQEVKYFGQTIRGLGDTVTRRCDYLSHFILRLAYCRSEELRRWFLARELEFFKLKFSNLSKDEVDKFMVINNLDYKAITDEEKRSLASDLLSSTSKMVNFDTSFYKVKFQQVLDLIRSRKVFVKGGFAYVPHGDLISILSTIFRTKLSHALSICAANISSLEGDERLARVLKGLHTSYTGKDYNSKVKAGAVQLASLKDLSTTSFPPCMRQMYNTFQKTHHLRHMARQEFGLFLKGIGLSLEDSLKFWRDGFTQHPDIDLTKFEKTYAYNIRHQYGVEGKRANYTPHSCSKIIMENVGPGDNHGCPFKHSDASNLKQKLLSYNIPLISVSEVSDLASRGHFQLACTKFFEITHGKSNVEGINHPNQYFEQSRKILQGEPEVKRKSDFILKNVTNEWGNDSFDITQVSES